MRYLLLALIFNFYCAFGQEVPEEAKKYYYRGQAALEIAKTNEDYSAAINEYNEAAKLAPNWADVYFAIGQVYEKMGKYADAIQNYKKYLELSPNAQNAETVRATIYKLEYKEEQEKKKLAVIEGWASGVASAKNSQPSFATSVVFKQVNGDMMMDLVYDHPYQNQNITAKFDGKIIRMNYTYYHFDKSVTDSKIQKMFTKKISFTGTVVSINPLVLDVIEVVKYHDDTSSENRSTWIFNK